jgi:hypothetical protein
MILANIATGATPTTAERRLLGDVLRAIDAAEAALGEERP